MYQAILLAAGESSRFWPLNQEHKSQIKILGKPLIQWTIEGLAANGIRDIIIVCQPDSKIKDQIRDGSSLGVKISYIAQPNPKGSGNAIFLTRSFIKGPFFVVHPYKFYVKDIIPEILEKEKKTRTKIILVGSPTPNPQRYGVLRFEEDRVLEICENPSKGKEPSNIKVLGIYFLKPDFFQSYEKLSSHYEKDFIEWLNIFLKENEGRFICLKKELPPLKYSWDFLKMLKLILESDFFKDCCSSTANLERNVNIIKPVFIGKNVKIGKNTKIYGPCFINNNCQIGENNIFQGPLDLEEGVKTGPFTKIKNSIIQEETSIKENTYLEDSVIGRGCGLESNFRTITQRMDKKDIKSVVKDKEIDTGFNHFGTVIGDNVLIGENVKTMPGVLIGSNAKIKSNSQVSKNIKDNS